MFERIVCLTEETVETLYLLGEDRRIVGVSGYAVRPARVRREKPRVSAFIRTPPTPLDPCISTANPVSRGEGAVLERPRSSANTGGNR